MMQNIAANTNTTHNDKPHLQPRIHDNVRVFMKNPALVHTLVEAFGSPLNIMFPQNIDENIKSFKDTYKKHHLRGRIYFTSKPCKSKSLLRQASVSDVGVDVSSSGSLNHVLSCGFSPDRIEATGPKNPAYIMTCLQLDVLLNVDSLPELHMIRALRSKLGMTRKARVMVRLCGFESTRMRFTPQDNTFGIHTKDAPGVLDWLVTHKDAFEFHGFSFYISGASLPQRLVAIENQLELTFLAAQKGLKPKGINIGGGFAIQYAEDPQQWDDYVESLKKSVLGEIEGQTWNNGGLGFREQNGIVAGAPLFLNHCPALTKGNELDHWLGQTSQAFGNAKFADIIRDSMLELYIEPGRGMLDQCGITLGRVNTLKESTWGETLVGLDMNRSNIHATHQKNLCAPVLIPRDKTRNAATDKGVYYIGNLCVSYDILQYNKTYPGVMPEPGDVVAFTNTAAYIMDFVESETLMHPVAQKIAVWQNAAGMKWAQDDQYLPVEV